MVGASGAGSDRSARIVVNVGLDVDLSLRAVDRTGQAPAVITVAVEHVVGGLDAR